MLGRPIQLLMICMLYLHFVQAHTNIYRMFEKRQGNNKYCGKHLVAALQLMCDGVYNPMFKRSSYYDEISKDWTTDPDIDIAEAIGYPLKHRSNALSLIPGTFRRRTRGAYDECCRKSCSPREMMQYCGTR